MSTAGFTFLYRRFLEATEALRNSRLQGTFFLAIVIVFYDNARDARPLCLALKLQFGITKMAGDRGANNILLIASVGDELRAEAFLDPIAFVDKLSSSSESSSTTLRLVRVV